MKIILILSLIILSACSSTKKTEYIGTYTQGHEVEIFKENETEQEYWIVGEDSVVDSLNDRVEEIRDKTNDPYPTVEVKFIGTDRGKAYNVLADENDKVLEIESYEIFE